MRVFYALGPPSLFARCSFQCRVTLAVTGKRIRYDRFPPFPRLPGITILRRYLFEDSLPLDKSTSCRVHSSIEALGKAHTRSIPLSDAPPSLPHYLSSSANGPMDNALSRLLLSAALLYASRLRAIDDVMFFYLCARRSVSQEPQHFRSSETRDTCGARVSYGLSV